ncbi:putative codeine 3-O-demethylase [Helianthus annuus]|nr:putative codeine 3-O-demethylase [Helianthus annuus]KAJ0531485.1 putative codeine 3-O-demethylase [Helianthus annuus]KAJ0698325.1 putative codeine 3-O-demethylase [Helianthus annuus]KAJ0881407.1 putative codeine 3-O-demethylase [Helianthus annuus]
MASVDSLPEKTPYQMAIDGDQPSSKYMINNNYTKFGSLEISPPFAPVPIIDIGCFVSSSKQDDQQAELDKLRSALTTWGCFQAVNHGLSESFLDIVQQVSKQFLELPLEEKKKYYREAGSSEGYGNDVTVSESQVQDWCDRLFLLLLPKDQRKLQFWPENPSNFRETIDDYTMKIKSISVIIFEAMAKSLDLEENCFSKQFTEEHEVMSARFLLYPPCPTPDQVLGLKAHSDKSGITFLLQDPEVEGLQVFKMVNGTWFL